MCRIIYNLDVVYHDNYRVSRLSCLAIVLRGASIIILSITAKTKLSIRIDTSYFFCLPTRTYDAFYLQVINIDPIDYY